MLSNTTGQAHCVTCDQGGLANGTVIDSRYRIIEAIGQGMSGWVYRAEQLSLEREVALKMLHSSRSHDPSFVASFRAEAQLASRIRDHHTAAIYDFGEHQSALYLVMELARGPSLHELLTSGRLQPARACALMQQFLDGLDAIHRAGVVHADLKPENVILAPGEDGERVVLIDFGIAWGGSAVGYPRSVRVTGSDVVAGTPGYIAPEVLMGEAPTPAADIYAAGVILFEMLTGSPPFAGDNLLEVMHRHACEPPPLPSQVVPGVSRAFDDVCLRAMSKDPKQRPGSAAELRTAVAAAEQRAMREARLAAAVTVQVPLLELRNPPYVGRDAIIEELAVFFESVRARAARLTGAPGSGRTTLVERAAAGCPEATVIRVPADPAAQREPYGPIRALLAALFDLPARTSVAGIASTMMAARRRVSDVPVILDLLDGRELLEALTVRQRRELCLSTVLAVVAERLDSRTTIVFDDADQYDEASREIVAGLAWRGMAAGARVLVITRPGDELANEAEQLVLEPLSHEAVAQVQDCLAHCMAAPPDAESLRRWSGGSPAHLEQLFRYFAELHPAEPPQHLDEIVAARLGMVACDTLAVLRVMAVYRRPSPLAWLSSLGEALGINVVAAIEDAERRGFARRVDGTARFACRTIGEVVYRQAPPRELQRLHQLVLCSSVEPPSRAARGWHALGAGRIEEGVEALCDAGKRALRFADVEDAHCRYREAFDLASACDFGGPRGGLELLQRSAIGLAMSCLELGRLDMAAAALQTARERSSGPAAWPAQMASAWACVVFAQGWHKEALHALRRVLRAECQPEEFVGYAVRVADLLRGLCGDDAAEAILRAARRELTRRRAGVGCSWPLLDALVDCRLRKGDREGALATAQEACAAARRSAVAAAIWRTRTKLAEILELLGDSMAAVGQRGVAEAALARAGERCALSGRSPDRTLIVG